MLIGAGADVTRGLGLKPHSQRETETTANIYKDLKLEKSLHPVLPLFNGE